MRTAWRPFLRYVSAEKAKLFSALMLALIQAVSLVPVALLIQTIFNRALPQGDAALLVRTLALTLVLFAVNALATLGNRRLALTVVKDGIHALRHDLAARSLVAPHEWYTGEDMDAAHARIVYDTGRLDLMANAFLSQFLPGVLVTAGLSCVLLYESPWLFVLVATALPVLYLLGKIAGRPVRAFTKQYQDDYANYSAGVSFMLKSGELIRLSTAERIELGRQDVRSLALRSSGFLMAWWGSAYGVLQNNALVVVSTCVLLVGGLQVIGGTMSLGALLSFYVALNLLISSARTAIVSIPTLIEGAESARRLLPAIALPSVSAGSVPFPGLKEHLVFEGVGFTYAGAGGVRDASFVIRKGMLFGIAGASGSGKSTLVHLLLGFHEPQEGRVTIDGRPVREFDPASYRSRVGVLPQNPIFFPGTIRENLIYGLDAPTDARIESVCKLCRIDAYVRGLERGYETEVGQLGAKLSGGQRQRLALARALLREPELLVLDEPDNHLDSTLRADILRAVRALPVTTLLITHDPDLLALADATYTL